MRYSNWEKDFTNTLNTLDSLGKPYRYKFKFGNFSTTSIRYLKTYLEIKNLFGNLDHYNVQEIGVGFGGQASIFIMLSQLDSYTFYDLVPTLNLSKKFITSLNLTGNFNFKNGHNPQANSYLPDLTISNYAFSELNRATQDAYLENVILKSLKGYMVWNSLGQVQLDGYSLADLIRIIPNSQIMPEIPNTALSNAIIFWGN